MTLRAYFQCLYGRFHAHNFTLLLSFPNFTRVLYSDSGVNDTSMTDYDFLLIFLPEPESVDVNVVNIGSRNIDVEVKSGDGHTEYIVLFISPEIPLRLVSKVDIFYIFLISTNTVT